MSELSLVDHLANFIGETVTIFTTSGGDSGSGFTGVLLSVNNCYVRLVTQIGVAPGCALGNCCEKHGKDYPRSAGIDDQYENNIGNTGRFNCRGNTVGSVTDIPVSRIASFVHNAV